MIRVLLKNRLCNRFTFLNHQFLHTNRPTQSTQIPQSNSYTPSLLLATLLAGGVAVYLYNKRGISSHVAIATNIHTQQNFTADELIGEKKLSRQERNFAENASYICHGVLYMSPADFLRMVTRTEHEGGNSITKIKLKEANKWLSMTSSKKFINHDRFLRDVWNRGFLSYPDYRFLLSTLIKSKNHFKTAFNIFDRDGSGDIELDEFIKVQSSCAGRVSELLDPRSSLLKSSLLIHLFGREGKGRLSFEEFSKFIDAFQKEVFYYEFNKYAKGNRTISSEDFANLILQYSKLPAKDIQARLHQRYGENIRSHPEFEFSQYTQFNTLLLNLEDFSTLLGIYNVSGKGVKKTEFNHAVGICCGCKLDPDLLEILYSIFDKDRDGYLSYEEFLDTVVRRQRRGAAVSGDWWGRYKTCFRSKVRAKTRAL